MYTATGELLEALAFPTAVPVLRQPLANMEYLFQ